MQSYRSSPVRCHESNGATEERSKDPRTSHGQKIPEDLATVAGNDLEWRANHVLQFVMGDLPPISLPVAPGQVPYSLAYLIRSDVVTPFTPSPPFGETMTSNLSLETRTQHRHRPILYKTSWILDTGEELPDQQGSKVMPQSSVRLPLIAQTMYDEGLMLK